MKVRGLPAVMVQESVFCRRLDASGRRHGHGRGGPGADARPIARACCPQPGCRHTGTARAGACECTGHPCRMVDKSRTRHAGDMAHVVNLSLLRTRPKTWTGCPRRLAKEQSPSCRAATATAASRLAQQPACLEGPVLQLDGHADPRHLRGLRDPRCRHGAPEDLSDSATRIREVIRAIQ